MDELEQLRNENTQLKEKIAILANINRSSEVERVLFKRKQLIHFSRFIDKISGKEIVNISSQQAMVYELEEAKKKSDEPMDIKIENAIERNIHDIPLIRTNEYQYREVPGEIEIQSVLAAEENADVYVLPTMVRGKTVIGIAEKAFQNKDVLEVKLPNSLKYIGREAFWDCTHLDKIELPESVEVLGKACFFGTGLRKITIPQNIKKIPYMCFEQCRYLESAKIEDGVEYIGANAFKDNLLIQLVIPKSVMKIEAGAFSKSVETPIKKKLHLYILGADTKFESISQNCRVYCQQGSTVEKKAISKKLSVRAINQYPGSTKT